MFLYNRLEPWAFVRCSRHAWRMGLKVLGNGKLTKKLTVQAQAFSKSAEAAINEAGGKIEVI